MDTRNRWCSIVLLLVCVFVVAGCGFFGEKVAYLRYGIGGEPETIDPRKSTSVAASIVEAQIFEGLASLDAQNNPAPAAAERWEVSADGLTYIFYLRKNAKWSNGDSVTARDFEYAWKSGLSPELGSSYAYQLFYLKNGEAYNGNKAKVEQVGVRALDDYTLEVVLEKPIPYFLSLTAFHSYYPVHAKTVSANSKWANDAGTVIGNGPFKLAKWVHESKLELVKNDFYWDKAKVKMNKIDLILVEASGTNLALFERGQLDMSESLPVTEIPRLLKENKVKIYPYLGSYYYSFNLNKPPFDNIRVRKALSLAIDRAAIVDKVTQGGQKPAMALVPYGLSDAKAESDFRIAGGNLFKDNDVQAAQQLLAQAGYPKGAGLPAITLLYNTSENHKLIAEAIQEMWRKNLGVQVTIANQEWKVFVDTLDKKDYQVARDGWIGDYPDPMTFIDLFESSGGNNTPGYKNTEYDRLVRLAKSSHSQGVRMQAMHIAENMLIDDAVIMPIYFNTNALLIKPNVKGCVRSSLGVVYLKEVFFEVQ